MLFYSIPLYYIILYYIILYYIILYYIILYYIILYYIILYYIILYSVIILCIYVLKHTSSRVDSSCRLKMYCLTVASFQRVFPFPEIKIMNMKLKNIFKRELIK